MEKKEATEEQLRIARSYGIPKEQAHTINPNKARLYHEWLEHEGSVEKFLDRLEESRGFNV